MIISQKNICAKWLLYPYMVWILQEVPEKLNIEDFEVINLLEHFRSLSITL